MVILSNYDSNSYYSNIKNKYNLEIIREIPGKNIDIITDNVYKNYLVSNVPKYKNNLLIFKILVKKQLQQTLQINKKIVSLGLQFQSFGNVSLKFKNYCLIKPSGVNLNKINYLDISVVDINTKKLIFWKKPSVDLPTHLIIYKNFPQINSIVHTHSIFQHHGRKEKTNSMFRNNSC